MEYNNGTLERRRVPLVQVVHHERRVVPVHDVVEVLAQPQNAVYFRRRRSDSGETTTCARTKQTD
jgi:hypothetical protein